MSIDDFIRKNEEERRRKKEEESKKPPEGVTYLYNINSYKIPKEVVELLKDFNNYIEDYPLDCNSKVKDIKSLKALIQTKSTNNKRMAVSINLYVEKYGLTLEQKMESVWSETHRRITEEEYEKKVKRYLKVGSQKFHDLNFENYYFMINSVKMEYEHIYYTNDGYIYVSPQCAEKLKKIDIDELGKFLADAADTEKRKAKIKRKDM